MNKHTFLLYLVLSVFFIPEVFAAQTKSREIVITGSISDEAIQRFNRKPSIYFYQNFSLMRGHEAEVFPVTIVNNRFKLKFTPKSNIGYFRFIIGPFIHSIDADAFLVESGDSICINMAGKDKVFFTGKEIDKFNYQLYVGKFRPFQQKGVKATKAEIISLQINQERENLRLALDSLNKIKTKVKSDVYHILRYNTTAAINANLVHTITAGFWLLDGTALNVLKQQMLVMSDQQRGFAATDLSVINSASSYPNYLFNFQVAFAQVFRGAREVPFEMIYDVIKSHYSGVLRDKIVAEGFLNYSRPSTNYSLKTDLNRFLPDALTYVKDSASLHIIQQFLNGRSPGVKAFDFSFIDAKGQKITLADFKGKLIVLDTWYNGCPGCISLAKVMAPVMEQYKDKKNIVFLAVSIDQQEQRFMEGVKSGLYGGEQTLYAFTGGRGQNDPFISFYKYISYPNLLIIDKNGRVVSANPPRPFDEARKKALLEMIDKNL